MARFPGILDRFRRLLAPPGRPAEALGVPAGGDDMEAELGPLLGELNMVGAEAARIEEEARLEAQRPREGGIREAAAILEEARGRADAERVRAAAWRRDEAKQEADVARSEARREAERIRAVVEDRLAEAVGELLECVHSSGR
jgi:hypothetical protein